MITLAFALLAAAQAPEPAPQMDNTPTPWPDPEREQNGVISKSDPEARQTLARYAVCVARSTPDEVAALFATEVGSSGEEQAASKLLPVVKLCAQDVKLETSVAGLRSIVATASFRLLAAQES